jgi:hypothetical protein
LKVRITWEFIVNFQLYKSIQFALTPQKLKLLSVTHKDNVHLEHSFLCCWNLDNSEKRSAIPGTFGSVVLEKDRKDQLDRVCEKWSVTKREKNILHKIKRRKANWTGHIFLGTAFFNTLLKETQTGRKEEEGDVRSYW